MATRHPCQEYIVRKSKSRTASNTHNYAITYTSFKQKEFIKLRALFGQFYVNKLELIIWPTMNFTSENAVNNQLSFLDVVLTLSGHSIFHELYQKPTHSEKYLSYTANCEQRIKWNIVFSETRRIISLCSDISLAWLHLDKLRQNLTNSGYPKEKVTFTILQQVRDLQQDHQPKPTPTRAWKDHYILRVPYCNEATTQILRAKIKKSHLPIKLVTTSGKTVGDVVKRSLTNQVNDPGLVKLSDEVKKIHDSNKIIVNADKSGNRYEISASDYQHLMHDNLTRDYKLDNENKLTKIDNDTQKHARSLEIADRMEYHSRSSAFLTIKDRKEDFPNTIKCRVINPPCNSLGKVSKRISTR